MLDCGPHPKSSEDFDANPRIQGCRPRRASLTLIAYRIPGTYVIPSDKTWLRCKMELRNCRVLATLQECKASGEPWIYRKRSVTSEAACSLLSFCKMNVR